MSSDYRTDTRSSRLKPAGPHLIERSADAPVQQVFRGDITVRRSYTAAVTKTIRPFSSTDTPSGSSQT